jgi:hypothetical protein
MPTSLYDQLTREHPAYRAGYAAGVDLGLRQALDIICAEWAAQVDAAIVTVLDDARRLEAARHEYAAGRLHAVASIVGTTFLTVQSD